MQKVNFNLYNFKNFFFSVVVSLIGAFLGQEKIVTFNTFLTLKNCSIFHNIDQIKVSRVLLEVQLLVPYNWENLKNMHPPL